MFLHAHSYYTYTDRQTVAWFQSVPVFILKAHYPHGFFAAVPLSLSLALGGKIISPAMIIRLPTGSEYLLLMWMVMHTWFLL